MVKKIAVSFATLALAVASAATHRINLYEPATVAGQELKPGAYKIEVVDNKAIIKGGKQTVEAAVKVENSNEKYRGTSVRYENAEGKMKVQEIRLGGTNTKLVFAADQTASVR
jgi:hypothetical protein